MKSRKSWKFGTSSSLFLSLALLIFSTATSGARAAQESCGDTSFKAKNQTYSCRLFNSSGKSLGDVTYKFRPAKGSGGGNWEVTLDPNGLGNSVVLKNLSSEDVANQERVVDQLRSKVQADYDSSMKAIERQKEMGSRRGDLDPSTQKYSAERIAQKRSQVIDALSVSSFTNRVQGARANESTSASSSGSSLKSTEIRYSGGAVGTQSGAQSPSSRPAQDSAASVQKSDGASGRSNGNAPAPATAAPAQNPAPAAQTPANAAPASAAAASVGAGGSSGGGAAGQSGSAPSNQDSGAPDEQDVLKSGLSGSGVAPGARPAEGVSPKVADAVNAAEASGVDPLVDAAKKFRDSEGEAQKLNQIVNSKECEGVTLTTEEGKVANDYREAERISKCKDAIARRTQVFKEQSAQGKEIESQVAQLKIDQKFISCCGSGEGALTDSSYCAGAKPLSNWSVQDQLGGKGKKPASACGKGTAFPVVCFGESKCRYSVPGKFEFDFSVNTACGASSVDQCAAATQCVKQSGMVEDGELLRRDGHYNSESDVRVTAPQSTDAR